MSAWSLAGALLLATAGPFPGCAGPAAARRLPVQHGPEGSTITIAADWDDVQAAAQTGASKSEMSILSREVTESKAEFRIQTLGGEMGLLTVTPVETPSPDRPGPIALTARVGLFRNQEAEQRLLSEVAARLKQLAGIRTAPIP
jgi:hypothetical protein